MSEATSPNSGHTATLSSTQIQPYGWTSHIPNPSGCVKSQKV